MQQLTELDASFLEQESQRTPMHISPIVFYDQSDRLARSGKKVRFKEILTSFRRNLHKSAIFRRKLAGGAMGFDTPYWIEDEGFDLEFHVRHIALPAPGDWRQLCILLARLQSRGLDMSRPLWEAYVIEGLNSVDGLPENSFAIMFKVHHAAIDGVSGAEIITAIHSLTDELLPPEVSDDWQPESPPSAAKVWSRAYVRNLRRPFKLIGTVSELIPKVRKANELRPDDESEARVMAPKTRFNRRVSPHRVTDALVMELDEVKALKNQVEGATVNDVIVAVVGGTLRGYLDGKGELPQQGLNCTAPISVRAERNSESSGNMVSNMTLRLCTDIEDPLERLAAVSSYARESKAYSKAIGASVMMDLTESLTPRVMGMSLRAGMAALSRADTGIPMHTVVSNVPGPQIPLYLAGARVHMLMGMGPVLDMMGLFHAVISGMGKITINFTACRECLPDPESYKSALVDSWEALKSQALQ